jgi:hypothetical protein
LDIPKRSYKVLPLSEKVKVLDLMRKYICNPSTQEAEAGRLQFWSQPVLHIENLSQTHTHTHKEIKNTSIRKEKHCMLRLLKI